MMQKNASNSSVVEEQTKVLIIGNGPSAISLSFMLSGHRPYYDSSNRHPDQALHQRLTTTLAQKSLLEADLSVLSQGLSGRSQSPVALLFDQLQHPNADFFNTDQPSTLSWIHQSNKSIDHLVVGCGAEPGGVWHQISSSKPHALADIQTVSRKSLMQLPGLNIERQDGRISYREVADYYKKYVDHFELGKQFRNNTKIVKVNWDTSRQLFIVDGFTKLKSSNNQRNQTTTPLRCRQAASSNRKCEKQCIAVRFLAKKIVLATGSASCHSMLNIPGEKLHSSFVWYSLTKLDQMMKQMQKNSKRQDPIVLVGCGLSAGDALLLLSNRIKTRTPNCKIIHVFRKSINDNSVIFEHLNENTHAEYAQCYQQMRQSCGKALCVHCLLKCPQVMYQAYQKCLLQSINVESRTVWLEFIDGQNKCARCQKTIQSASFKACQVLVLIGCRPVLDFLPDTMRLKLPIRKDALLDAKNNPADVNPYTYQCNRLPGIYAIGPLAGDNFVRFIQGGAFAVANHLTSLNSS